MASRNYSGSLFVCVTHWYDDSTDRKLLPRLAFFLFPELAEDSALRLVAGRDDWLQLLLLLSSGIEDGIASSPSGVTPGVAFSSP